ncbi:MAG TPA: sigma 54-interacting transcriptional regulator [Thermoanaerobaculia bacterium]|nr:sigma 54-interacting transcriptional regulator [Thermoanaerobaculia bacterium]
MTEARDLDARRDELKLETLYDQLVALHAHRTEQELVEDLLQRICAVVDPSAAAAVTRDAAGEAHASSMVGWEAPAPSPRELLEAPLFLELQSSVGPLVREGGEIGGRGYRQLVAVPLRYRETLFGYLALVDKERRGGGEVGFSEEDRRFVQSVAALAGVTLDGLRQFESLLDKSERLEEENKLLKERLVHQVAGQRIVAEGAPMRRVIEIAERVAPRSVNVLIRGESGTGKELIARLLHHRSERPGPLVVVNCAALPETLLESELFGIEGGVATGVQARIGKFELADRGTLFLDEIGDLVVSLQVKLLRALQEREVVRIGGHRAKKVDVRLVTATHQPLEELVEQGSFREDLYYRIKGVEIQLPPLRERREDIPQMVRHFVEQFCRREAVSPPVFQREALAMLMGHDYPGNVRELQSLVDGAVSLADGIVDADLISSLMGGGAGGRLGPEALDLDTVKSRHIRRVLRMTSGNKSAAARILGVDRRTLARKGF